MNPTHNPPASAEMTPADLLRAAALYIQRHGWHQGAMFATANGNPFPPACAIGGIRAAVTGCAAPGYAHNDDTPAVLALYENVLAEFAVYLLVENVATVTYTDDTFTDLPRAVIGDWNDETSRDAAEVIQTLNEAADEWDRIHTHRGDR